MTWFLRGMLAERYARNDRFLRDMLGRPGSLHLVLPQIVVVQAFEIFPQLLAGHPVRHVRREFRSLQHNFLDEDWTIHAQSQRERIRGPRIDADYFAPTLQPDIHRRLVRSR